jgi:beta-lactamase class A
MKTLLRRLAIFCAAAFALAPGAAFAQDPNGLMPAPLIALRMQLLSQSRFEPGRVAVAVRDLATGYTSGINLDTVMPAASTIKVPVMVEVFNQMNEGKFGLQTELTLLSRDKDWGWGDLADASPGTRYSVSNLLRAMIDESDNTATNMLIRLVGRDHINITMKELGLHHTFLKHDVRTDTEAVRSALRTTPNDMVTLMDKLAHEELIDEWSSREMVEILTHQHHNGLLPAPLPPGTAIAHKTGSLHDTLNDVGIVYHDQEPYAIAVMTTHWPTLDEGRTFIHRVSSLAYRTFSELAVLRENAGLPGFTPQPPAPQAPIQQIPGPDDAPAGGTPDQPAVSAPLDSL